MTDGQPKNSNDSKKKKKKKRAGCISTSPPPCFFQIRPCPVDNSRKHG